MPTMSKSNPISVVHHPNYGTGHVLEIRPDPLPLCRCEQCKANPRPSHLMLVRWVVTNRSNGVSGGWYDPMNERFTFEDTVAIAHHIRACQNPKP